MSHLDSSAGVRCVYVTRDEAGQVRQACTHVDPQEFPEGEVQIRVLWSSLNYKDALAATGHPGVARRLPHVPGIDAAGVVEASRSPAFHRGQEVLVTGHELGAPHWGGWADMIRVPAAWVVAKPPDLSLRETMIYGTAGLTAALCLMALQRNEVTPDRGPIVVTGATGGVGSVAVNLLAQAGYRVAAVSGKADRRSWLEQLGAAEVLGRADVVDSSDRPLLGGRWAGAIDTVGGETLATILRATQPHGCVAACGLVGGADLPLTVHPFILRGVTLAGVTSSGCPDEHRLEAWRRLAGPWRIPALHSLAQEVSLPDVIGQVPRILAGEIVGRTLVRVTAED